MILIWVVCILLIAQGLVALVLRWSIHTFGAYVDRMGVYVDQLLAAQRLNIEIRKNLAIQRNEEAISYITDNPTEREA